MTSLLNDESDTELNLTINKQYAEKYESWRQKEELQKLKDRYGENAANSTDDSSSSDDVDEEDIQKLDTDFLKTLSYLKNKDPRIYDKNVKFFKDQTSEEVNSSHNKNKDKPIYLRDYERKLIVERGGRYSDDEGENYSNNSTHKHAQFPLPTLVEQERAIKESFKTALNDSDDENENAWGGLFQKRQKTQQELDKENEEFKDWLKGERSKLSDEKVETELKPLHDYWNDPQLNEGERYLKDYILSKRYLENEDGNRIPTYDEVVHDSDDGLSEDEETLKQQEQFERKFNFRFEEPDHDFVKRYPRTVENSLRKKDDRRKEQRELVRERKLAEKIKKKEEIKRLKALKRKEIEEKIQKLKEITGNTELGFKDEDIEGDFDPAEYDKRMNHLFSENFYQEEGESEKPKFPDLDEELELENWDQWKKSEDLMISQDYYVDDDGDGPHCEDPNFNMDCDYDPKANFQKEMMKSVKGRRRNRKRRSKLAEVLSVEKPAFDPSDKTFEEYFNEYYNLDFEDVIGDMACRFKYRNVIPNDFGLSVDEILKADEKELNKWCSLRKAVQYRPETVEQYDLKVYKKKGQNEFLKKKYLTSLYSEQNEEETEEGASKKKRKRKKKRNLSESAEEGVQEQKRAKMETESFQTNFAIDSVSENKEMVEKMKIENFDNTALCNYVKEKKKKKIKQETYNNSNKTLNASIVTVTAEPVSSNVLEEKKSEKKKQKRKRQKEKSPYDSKICGFIEDDVATEGKKSMNKNSKKDSIFKKYKLDKSDENGIPNSRVETEIKLSKRKRKHDKKKKSTAMESGQVNNVNEPTNKKFKKKNKLHKKFGVDDLKISDARLRAYGIRPKKFKNRLKYGNQEWY